MTTTDAEFDQPSIGDFFGDVTFDPYDRPERTEDRVPRDGKGRPRILPLGKVMPLTEVGRDRVLRTFYRPSDYGEVLEDKYRLELWHKRNIVNGMLDDKGLRLEWSNIGETEQDSATKEQANEIMKRAEANTKADRKAVEGSAVHALSERNDLGLEIRRVPEEFEGNLADWRRLISYFEVQAVECFVVQDEHRLAGTFDRLLRYHEPCRMCGNYLRIADLKTGRTDFGAIKMSAQLGIYAHSAFYDPATGARTSLGEVCLCRGIIFDIPSGAPEGTGRVRWLNIGQGWNESVRLATEVRNLRKKDNWWLEFSPTADLMPLIDAAPDRATLNLLYKMNKAVWADRHTAASEARLAQIEGRGPAV